ncbi:arabinofuranosyltransferase [Nocardia transvalensis]|uniref:Arabinofuranosyltransferase n=1 Tax=Nocardia transvalensis TaxID=37333 RepID=A0A7W9PDI3_9NOCA|nr:arabinofuranosyltransferase [Nocardia transvalensis]
MVEGEGREDGPPTSTLAVGDGEREASASRFARLSRATFVGGVALTVVLFAAGAWQRRWIADDGLIVLRTVRNLLAGNGPVFNAGERVETNTSAAWTYVVWFFSWLTHARLEYVVLAVALAMSVLAVVFAMLGAARLWGGTAGQLLLPAGAIVYIAVPPARDYATSGLENCLVIFWLGVLWYLMMRWSQAAKPGLGSYLGVAFWAGLSWLVRPEMTVLGGLVLLMVFCAPMPQSRLTLLRPIVIRALLVAVGGAIPVGYQIWRMGYYGLPYPNTAVAKEASGAKWGQGFTYLWDLVGPYFLWLPVGVLAAVAVFYLMRRPSSLSRRAFGRDLAEDSGQKRAGKTGEGERAGKAAQGQAESVSRLRAWQRRLRSPRAVVALMLFAGLLLIAFNLRVGGDFMHGRMLLPQLFILLLPVSVVPVRLPEGGRAPVSQWVRGPVLVPLAGWVIAVGWAMYVSGTVANTSGSQLSATGIVDERIYYVLNSGHDHPILAEDYLDYPRMRAMLEAIENTPDGGLLINSPSFMMWYVAPPPLPIPDGGAGHTVYFLNLGMTSMNVPLDVRVIDQEGLAYPLAAHTDRLVDGRIGHDKNLFADWVLVDLGMVDRHPWMPWFMDEKWVIQARTALSCPATQDLLASYRAPLTRDRFKHNIIQSLHFAKYRIDRVPKYEIQRCHLVDPIPSPVPN